MGKILGSKSISRSKKDGPQPNDPDYDLSIGGVIRSARERARKSQNETGKQLNISQEHISQLETNYKNKIPSPGVLKSLADFFGKTDEEKEYLCLLFMSTANYEKSEFSYNYLAWNQNSDHIYIQGNYISLKNLSSTEKEDLCLSTMLYKISRIKPSEQQKITAGNSTSELLKNLLKQYPISKDLNLNNVEEDTYFSQPEGPGHEKGLGKVIREARLKAGKSQDKAAKMLGISQSYYSRIELDSRTSMPSSEDLKNLAKFLGKTNEEAEYLYSLFMSKTGRETPDTLLNYSMQNQNKEISKNIENKIPSEFQIDHIQLLGNFISLENLSPSDKNNLYLIGKLYQVHGLEFNDQQKLTISKSAASLLENMFKQYRSRRSFGEADI